MKQCQVCGHGEELKSCPQCGRHTCESCFKIQKKQGYSKKDCLYCGYEFKPIVVFTPPPKPNKLVFIPIILMLLIFMALLVGFMVSIYNSQDVVEESKPEEPLPEPEPEPEPRSLNTRYNITVIKITYGIYMITVEQTTRDWYLIPYHINLWENYTERVFSGSINGNFASYKIEDTDVSKEHLAWVGYSEVAYRYQMIKINLTEVFEIFRNATIDERPSHLWQSESLFRTFNTTYISVEFSYWENRRYNLYEEIKIAV